jgi:hypothetical protein
MPKSKRKASRHGGWLWLKRGEVHPDCEEIRRGVARLAADLADEFAGPGRPLSASQMVLIDRTCQLTAFLKIVERSVWKEGPVAPDESGAPTVAPALGNFYIAAGNAVSKALRTLAEVSGRPESDRPPPDLKSYLLAKTNGTSEESVPETEKNDDAN